MGPTEENQASQRFARCALVSCAALFYSHMITSRVKKQQDKKVEKWRRQELMEQFNKQEAIFMFVRDSARKCQETVKNDLLILRAFYGSKRDIEEYLLSDPRIQITYQNDQHYFYDLPKFICDVTIFCRFHLDQTGLNLKCKDTKNDVMGFFNPIPPFVVGHQTPHLCVIYKRGDGVELSNRITVQYFRDSDTVKIPISH
mmetsp:Transcript_19466/g.18582  ORF Transcript_19466/g.18582 Transcript_19466/m.18582 type:complete len:200 (+) Transcript_19466:1906-2505(+)